MKTLMKLLVLGAVTLLTGCGPGDRTRDLNQEEKSEVFEVRMLGSNASGLSAALLPVAGVTAATRGLPLDVEPMLDTVDLTNVHHAWLLGRVLVPESAQTVDFTVQLDDAGGYESPLGNGAVEARRVAISWRAPVAWLRTNGHVVIDIDLERSLVETGPETRRLIPAATIRY